MRIVVGTGTDVASVGLGDPSLLSSLSDCQGRGFEKLRSEALASGALWLTQTGADGAYLFHLYVDEDPPQDISPHLHDPIVVERLRVPSGKLRVAGEECFIGALTPTSHPHMGAEVELEPGDYHMTAFRSDAADELLDTRFQQITTPLQRQAWTFGNNLSAFCVAATIAALALGYFIYLRTVSVWLSLVPFAGAAGLWAFRTSYCRGPTYKGAEKVYRTIEMELPSIAVVLKKREAAQQRAADKTG